MTSPAVAVVIPARDEAAGISESLRHVLRALGTARAHSSIVVVAADSCIDETAEVARAVLGERGVVVEGEWGVVGRAREAGTRAALATLGTTDGWLANTDADTIVPPGWIRHQLAHGAAGAGAVAGIVRVASFDEHPRGTASAFAREYRVPDNGAHTHVHAANLGFSIAAYVDSGGWPPVGAGEDQILWDHLRSRGWPVHACARLTVRTSGRRHGRVRGGFADALRHIGERV